MVQKRIARSKYGCRFLGSVIQHRYLAEDNQQFTKVAALPNTALLTWISGRFSRGLLLWVALIAGHHHYQLLFHHDDCFSFSLTYCYLPDYHFSPPFLHLLIWQPQIILINPLFASSEFLKEKTRSCVCYRFIISVFSSLRKSVLSHVLNPKLPLVWTALLLLHVGIYV